MENRNYNFQKLTPIKDVDLDTYKDALDFIFNNDDIKNAAITGAYSAGKSSLLESYKLTKPEKKFLHISLAHFTATEENTDTPLQYNETILEGKILNQLIHQIDSNDIPQTHFKVKKTRSEKSTKVVTSLFITFSVLIMYMIGFTSWTSFVDGLSQPLLKNILGWTTNSNVLLFSGIVCLTIFSIGFYFLLSTQFNKNMFRKINFQGNEIEIFEESEESYFDKYLNEVIYLFENSGADVIVFEDMDRYNINQIFEKLREINSLVNTRKGKTLRFFYLLRDDVFISKDRTKFFDFIIPVVPVIDGSNSYEKFIEHFKLGEIYDLFDEKFLQSLSLYVDDLRVLKNIYNEFIIYHGRINSIELNNNKLLAIITYKNIFPKDFSNLQLGNGYVHTLFENKSIFTNNSLQEIEQDINAYENFLKAADNEHLSNIDELDSLYFKAPGSYPIQVNNQSETSFESRADLIRAIKDPTKNVQYLDNYRYWNTLDVDTIFNSFTSNEIYIERKKAIETKFDDKYEHLATKINQLKSEKTIIQNSRLETIITKENIDNIFDTNFINEIGVENTFKEVESSSYFHLIKYLIRNGYIDESYPDYMTYFYENSLSREDKIFLRSITDEVSKEYSYDLKNPKLVVSRLRISDFDHIEVLNFDLFSYLLQNHTKYEEQLSRLFSQMKSEKNYTFITEFSELTNATISLTKSINLYWHEFYHQLINTDGFSHSLRKNLIINAILFSSSDSEIKSANIDNCITKFISNDVDFLDTTLSTASNVQKLISGFKLLKVKMKDINFNKANHPLFIDVYKNDLYELNFNLISLILEHVYHIPTGNDYFTRNYSLINSNGEAEPLLIYVNNNINQYMSIIIEKSNNHIADSESIALLILNNEDIDLELKEQFINYLDTIINDISTVKEDSLWSILLQNTTVKYSSENILLYFFSSEPNLDDYLIDFINSSSDELSFNPQLIDEQFGENSTSTLLSAVIECNELVDEKYQLIINSLGLYYEDFSFAGISNSKIEILIESKLIEMNEQNLLFMRREYSLTTISFIKQNIVVYTESIINPELFSLEELLILLESDISDLHKLHLLSYTNSKISTNEKAYSIKTKKYILENNLDTDDIPSLIKSFDTEDKKVQDIIINSAIDHVDIINGEQIPTPFLLLNKLLLTERLELDVKKKLLYLALPDLNKAQVIQMLSTLHMNSFSELFIGKRPKIEVTPINHDVLSYFKSRNWISSFAIDSSDSNYYRAIGRKI
ncbi:hypothetical protein [Sporosarcina limicola]|uniref:YobI-like P-loop NTPase domain-containing protein n=1 Tax=Sporosarcina limicola TaxID=34101 RepID=A0A927RCZ5_9BACL|nr:hypothetical protein [Sporosarcina limicola]MBE1553202.1 hypothetical protein [Sporosarcina limicola]